ncbi:MAG: hypothetical protein NT121_00215, partial [Chloroflexi bacterium]|nr:hypothetical protein [Chloroflexota bacterium]
MRLRENALKDVQAAYQSRQDPVGEARIRYLAEIAEGLRQAYLLESREEREAAQWVEIEKARLEHEDYARLDDWDAAVSLWEDLDRHYPRMAIVQTYLQTAHIQQALLRADTALREDKGQDALNILWEAQRDFTLSRSCELNLKLAEVYANREDFSRAYEILTSLESSDKCAKDASQKIAQFQKEEQILGFLHQAEAENNKEHYPEALKILLEDAPKNQLVEDDKRLVDLAMIIFSKRSQVLSEMIETQNKIGTYSAKVNALNAALELRL